MSATDCPTAFENNPDISGVGVRVSFYLQTFFLVLLVDRSWPDAPVALWTFIATSFGLTIAALIQTQEGRISLFQALQVSNLVWLANFGTFLALASYSRHKSKGKEFQSDYHVKFGAMLQTSFSMVLTLYLWVNAANFGNSPECSPLVHYVLFVIKVPAFGSGRIVALTISSLLMAAYFPITLHELRTYRVNCKAQFVRRNRGNSLPLPVTVPAVVTTSHPLQRATSPATTTPAFTLTPRTSPVELAIPSIALVTKNNTLDYASRPKRRRWSSDLDPMLIGLFMCQLLVLTYFIVSIELLFRYNPVNAASNWEFGQILALILVIPSALSVTKAMSENGFQRKDKRKKHVYVLQRRQK